MFRGSDKKYYEELTDVADKLLEFYNNIQVSQREDVEVVIGTDSNRFSDSKIVLMILIHNGKDYSYFYEITDNPKVKEKRTKIFLETNLCIDLSKDLLSILESGKYSELYEDAVFGINVSTEGLDSYLERLE